KERMDKEKLNWRSFAHQEAVNAQWNPNTPGYYVLDPRGVIRYKWVGAPGEKAIDTALEKLISEAEADKRKPPKCRCGPRLRCGAVTTARSGLGCGRARSCPLALEEQRERGAHLPRPVPLRYNGRLGRWCSRGVLGDAEHAGVCRGEL